MVLAPGWEVLSAPVCMCAYTYLPGPCPQVLRLSCCRRHMSLPAEDMSSTEDCLVMLAFHGPKSTYNMKLAIHQNLRAHASPLA